MVRCAVWLRRTAPHRTVKSLTIFRHGDPRLTLSGVRGEKLLRKLTITASANADSSGDDEVGVRITAMNRVVRDGRSIILLSFCCTLTLLVDAWKCRNQPSFFVLLLRICGTQNVGDSPFPSLPVHILPGRSQPHNAWLSVSPLKLGPLTSVGAKLLGI